MDSLRVGVSSCLLGEPVRYDGGHRRDPFVVDALGPFVEFVPVCPEVELGLGTPRETLRLVRRAADIRLVMAGGQDHTDAMRRFAAARAAELARADLSGYILKKNSPSCGLERVTVYDRRGVPAPVGRGLFAEALADACPHLPIEEEGRLQDPVLRENFIERLFAYRRLASLFDGPWTVGDLVAFHTAHRLALLAHSTEACRSLGRLVAGGASAGRAALRDRYTGGFMTALARPATPKKHANVLLHMLGCFRDRLDDESREELRQTIEDCRVGLVPLIVPITLVRHHVRRLGVDCLAGQTYLQPHPNELRLRNRV